MRRRFGWLLLPLLHLAIPLQADDWPQYRGPSRHGVAGGSAELLADWEAAGPAELWRRPIGNGYSAVTVVGDRLYLMAAEGEEELVLCLDAADGTEIWRKSLGASAPSDMDDNGPRSTPTVAADTVYTASSSGLLVALQASDGALLWDYDLMAGGKPPRFGYSVSPLADGGRILIEGGSTEEEPGVYAFDGASGELLWTALSGPAGYSSPIAIEIGGRRQYVFFRRAGTEVVSLSTDGNVLWRHPTSALAIITTPIFLPPSDIFVASADDVFGGLMLRVEPADGDFQVAELWSERLMRNHFNTSVAVGGHLYGFDNGTLRCLDTATGARRWAKRGLGKGSLIAAGDLLFVLGDDGTLVLVEASAEEFRERGRVQATSGRSWTAPSLAAGRLYLRDFDEVVAYDLSTVAAPPATAAEPTAEEGR